MSTVETNAYKQGQKSVREQLARVLTCIDRANESTATCNPGNDLAEQQKQRAIGARMALATVALDMGLKTRTEYVDER